MPFSATTGRKLGRGDVALPGFHIRSMSDTPQYVAGFLFRTYPATSDNLAPHNQVALIRKNKPAWQKGKLNGIGGKIEPGETPYDAICREFLEEAGVVVAHWRHFCKLSVEEGGAVIHFFAAECTEGRQELLRSITDEEVAWYYSSLLMDDQYLVANLRWLVPLARESLSNHKRATISSERP